MLLQLRWLGRARPAVCAQTQNLRERGPARAPRLPPPAPALSLALPTPRAGWPPPGSLATPRVPSARAPGSRRGGDVRSQGRQAVRGVCVVCVFAALAHKTLDQIRQPGRSVRSRGRNLEVWGSRRSSSGPGTVPARVFSRGAESSSVPGRPPDGTSVGRTFRGSPRAGRIPRPAGPSRRCANRGYFTGGA